ncbi:hypothetical protein ID866_5140 [Astraeus odoratus]|nr:hypothetical protein ID866_5140 [Astraeus odoratus]
MTVAFLLVGMAYVAVFSLWVTTRMNKKARMPCPPGPKGLPFVGNACDINTKEPHLTYTEWGKIYGNIVYFRVFGQEFIAVNSEKTASALADKRSTIYSDRPHSPIYRIFGVNHMTPVVRYGNEWRTHKKLLHGSLRHDVVDRYEDLYLTNAHRLLVNMQNDSVQFYEHFDMYAGAIALEFTYGRKVETKDDPVLMLATGLVHELNGIVPQRVALLMALPIPHGGVEESDVKETTAGVYIAARDAVAAPHATTSSDVFEGYYIPRGAIVIFNTWAMRSNEDSDPERFDPARHLTSDGQLQPEAKQHNSKYFGFGRRICPGRFFAEHALWAAAATMLSTLRFEKAKDSFGNDIDVEPVFRYAPRLRYSSVMTTSLPVGVSCTILIALWFMVRLARKSPGLPYPPGPKGLPIIGNALEVDLKEPHITYIKWSKIYGDIVYSRILGRDFLIVNSEKIARILADQRAPIYSDRPYSPIYRMFGLDHMTPVLKYGTEWRTHRKLLHLSLRHDVINRYQDLHLRNARILLENIRRDSNKFYEHFDIYAAASSLEFTYGHKMQEKDDPVIALAGHIAEKITKGVTGERTGLLMALPILEHLPSWFPGAAFKKDARRCKDMIATISDRPFMAAKEQVESTGPQRNLVSDILTHGGVGLSDAKDTAAGIYLAAAESTSSTLNILVLAMILNPEVQEKVHSELVSVVGRGVLPTFEDRERLPYLQAVLFELMRWRPVFPLGVPHSTTSSDIYEGYYIPKGTMVIFNTWAMMNRECSDPETFDPTRHLTADGQLTPEAKQNNLKYFGFGRRICPGRYFADSSLWAAAAVLLSALRFERAKDSSGNFLALDPVFRHGVVSHPEPYQCSITSRFDGSEIEQ